MSIQSIRRALVLPPVSSDADEWMQQFVRGVYMPLAQQVQLLQSHFQTFAVTWGGGAAHAIALPVPTANLNYGVTAELSANLGAVWVTAKATTGFTFNTAVAGAATAQFLVWSNS